METRTPNLIGPGPIYLTGEEALRVTTIGSVANVVLTVTGRLLTFDGVVMPIQMTPTLNTDRTSATTLQNLGQGWLLGARVAIASGTVAYGQVWALIELVRGQTGAVQPLVTLASGIVTTTLPLTFPGGAVHNPVEQLGAVRSIAGTNPAAGAEVSETVPTGARWLLHALSVRLVVDATVANREPMLTLDDGATVFARFPLAANITASQTRDLTWAAVGAALTATQSNTLVVPLPPIPLLAGYRIRTVTANLQAADDYGAPQLLVEEQFAGV